MDRERHDQRETLAKLLRQPPKFALGRIVATRNALDRLAREEIEEALARHHRGDWGELDDEDRAANDAALRDGSRILSAYTAGKGEKVWVITEADRSATTVLLPEDY